MKIFLNKFFIILWIMSIGPLTNLINSEFIASLTRVFALIFAGWIMDTWKETK